VVATHAKDIVDEMQKRVITISKGKIKRDEEGGYGNETSELEILF
jgi:cell division transport system ATP-binding protein